MHGKQTLKAESSRNKKEVSVQLAEKVSYFGNASQSQGKKDLASYFC